MIVTSASFVLFVRFPNILTWLSNLLHIKEPVNSLFLIITFFLLLNLFTLTIALSGCIVRITSLSQELGITNMKLTEMEEKVRE